MPYGPENHYGFTQEEVDTIKKFVTIAIENKIPLEQIFPGEERLAQEAAFLYLLLTNPDAKWVFACHPDPIDSRDLYADQVMLEPTTVIKRQVDLTPKFSMIENQGELGSCVAQSIVGAIELYEKTDNTFIDRSRLYVYYNGRLIMGTVNEDSGMYVRDALKACQKYGVCVESIWPYELKLWKTQPTKEAYADGANFKINKYLKLNENDVAQACSMLDKGVPVIFGQYCFNSITSTKILNDGILEMPSSDEKNQGGHCTVLVGYDLDTQYFKVRNSWGNAWGKGGYYFMPFQFYQDYTFSPWVIMGLG
jgi:C1A family cysteine protease